MSRRLAVFCIMVGGLLIFFFLGVFWQPGGRRLPPQVEGVSDHLSMEDADLIGESLDGDQTKFWSIDLEEKTVQPAIAEAGIIQVKRTTSKKMFWVRRSGEMIELVGSDETGSEEILTVSFSDLVIVDVAADGKGVLYQEGRLGESMLYWRDGRGQTHRLGSVGETGVFADGGNRVLHWLASEPPALTTLVEGVRASSGDVEDVAIGDFGEILNATKAESGVWLIDRLSQNGSSTSRLFHRSFSSSAFEKLKEWKDPFGAPTIPDLVEISSAGQIYFLRKDATGYTEWWSYDRSTTALNRKLRGGYDLIADSQRVEIFFLKNEINDASQPGRLMRFNLRNGSVSDFSSQFFKTLSR